MTYTVTTHNLSHFVLEMQKMLEHNSSIIVDCLKPEDLYINSEEYLAGRSDQVYDMSDPVQYNNFFTSLKSGA